MTQTFAGRTPKGHELYREVGGDHWFVREPVKSPGALKALNTVRDLHRRRPIGRSAASRRPRPTWTAPPTVRSN